MEQNIFEVLQGLEGEVKGTNTSGHVNIEYCGSIKIERGNFSMDIHFYAKVYETKHKEIVMIDDWDVHDEDNYNLNGLPIDSLSSFKAKLTDWGFSGIGKKLEFTNEENKRAIAMAMLESEELKKIYGKNFKVWNLLSVDEQMLLDLNFVVENFNTCGVHIKNIFAKHYDLGVGENTTLKQFQSKLKEVSK
jgi:hypothetical protein